MKMKGMSVKWYASDLTKEMRKEGKKALLEVAEDVLGDANKDVPHDEGTLMRSGETSADETPKGIGANVSYDTPYARRLHENPQYRFNKGRKGKWLEDVINKNRQKYIRYLATKYGHLFKGKL